MKKTITACSLIMAVVCLAAGCGNGDSTKYENAMSLYEQGEYREACDIFEELEDYEESEEMVLACKYAEADEYYEEKDYEAAISIYETISDYSDSAEKIISAKAELALPEIAEKMEELAEATDELNIQECYSLIDEITDILTELDDDVYVLICEETGYSIIDTLETEKEELQSLCINNTSIAIPVYVITSEYYGYTLVNDHGDFAAYNTFFNSSSACQNSFQEYKEYISQYTTITDETASSYLATDESGNEITVIFDTDSTYPYLQIRVPRF